MEKLSGKAVPHRDKKLTVKVETGSAARATAALCLKEVITGQSYSVVFPRLTADSSQRDRALIQEMVLGTLRHWRLLNETLRPMLSKDISAKNLVLRALILCGLYQLSMMRIPAHAVVSATVGACGPLGFQFAKGMTNAVLRRFLREECKLKRNGKIETEYSCPDWLYQKLQSAYGAFTEQILNNSNQHPPMWIRIELSKISREDYMLRLSDSNINATCSDVSAGAILIHDPRPVWELPGYSEGLFAVQDLSAQLCATLLDLKDGMKVLDCCAAPGGKTLHILDLCPSADLTSMDISKDRMVLIEDNLKRLKRHARLVCKDVATAGLSADIEKYDRILVDAPCSGTGVIRRHPDIKWLRRSSDIAGLCETQSKILEQAFAALKTGGIMLYTTCSILPEENCLQFQQFLANHPNAKALPFEMNGKNAACHQRLPGDDGGDGFFYARIIKLAVD